MPLAIRAIPCLSDNYIWLLRDEASGAVAVCDPGEAAPAAAVLREGGGRVDLFLLTHHHGDHVAGPEVLKAAFGGKGVGNEADRVGERRVGKEGRTAGAPD